MNVLNGKASQTKKIPMKFYNPHKFCKSLVKFAFMKLVSSCKVKHFLSGPKLSKSVKLVTLFPKINYQRSNMKRFVRINLLCV